MLGTSVDRIFETLLERTTLLIPQQLWPCRYPPRSRTSPPGRHVPVSTRRPQIRTVLTVTGDAPPCYGDDSPLAPCA